MKDTRLYNILTHQKIKPALNPILTKLFFSLFFASITGITMVLGFWSIVKYMIDKQINWIFGSVVLWLISGVSAGIVSYVSHSAEATFSNSIRYLIVSHMVRLPASKLTMQDNTDLKKLIKEDVDNLHHLLAHLPTEFVTFLIVPLLSISLLITMVGLQSLWVLLPAMIASSYYLIIVPKITVRDGAARMQVMGDIITAVDDYTRGIRVHRIYNGWQGQSLALKNYRLATTSFSQNMVMWVSKVATMAGLSVALLQAVATFAIAYVIAYQYDTATLAATLFFSLAIVTPALRLGHGLDYVTTAKNSSIRIIEFLNQPSLKFGKKSDINKLLEPCSLRIVQAQLIIENRVLFDNFNYNFSPKTVTAITAPSGTGKTMMLQVLAGFESLTKGEVYIEEYPILAFDENSHHQAILFIPQGNDVLPLSIRDNLKMVNNIATEDMLLTALDKVKLNINLDSQAQSLSGGERQRLCIAKIFLSTANIILLDEPTSALDSDLAHQLITELYVYAHTHQKTLIIVTHDEKIADRADYHISLNDNLSIKQEQ